MPITKVPVVHKFGIISHSQRLELQQRLLKQSYDLSLRSKQVQVSQRNPLDVTEDFIQQFNSAVTLEEKEHFEAIARKMLERSKRRAGIRNLGIGHHVNLPMAWTELAQLSHCKGQIQEECLDVLIASLDISPLAKYHIPALFFLAEIMLYYLRTEAVYQPYLRTSEIKLLKMGELVFQRLFYHHMAGQLQGHSDFKDRLFMYTDGLTACQDVYNPYPNALLSLRFIIEVSKIILVNAVIDAGEVKEGDKLSSAPVHNREKLELETREMYEKELRDKEVHTAPSGAISSSVHDLSPTLWHALDVWRCTHSLGGGFKDALKALARCGLGLANESWVDGVMALNILADAARADLTTMKVFHNLARGEEATEICITPSLSHSGGSDILGATVKEDAMRQNQVSSEDSFSNSKPSLSDIYERSNEGDAGKKRRSLTSSSSSSLTHLASASSRFRSSLTSIQDTSVSHAEGDENSFENLELSSAVQPKPLMDPAGGEKTTKSREVSFDETTTELKYGNSQNEKSGGLKKNMPSRQTTQEPGQHSTKSESDTAVGTGTRPEVGSEFFTSRGSNASSAPTFTNIPQTETPGLNGWHWEVAFTYAEMLANICIHGRSANIQKMALVGNHFDASDPYRRQVASSRLSSAGLLDLLAFCSSSETDDGGPNDWSWRVRFGAVQALVKVVHSLEGVKSREGLRTAAWNALLHAGSAEKDGRVLEALKVGQVHTDMEKLQGKEAVENYVSIGSRIGAGLSMIYLPPVPPPVDVSASKATSHRHHKRIRQQVLDKPTCRQPLRTSLKEELDLAMSLHQPPVDYNTRTSFDLRRIVEDQWRKEMQKNLEEEEEERRKNLENKQKEEEAQQKLVEKNRVLKLQSQKEK